MNVWFQLLLLFPFFFSIWHFNGVDWIKETSEGKKKERTLMMPSEYPALVPLFSNSSAMSGLLLLLLSRMNTHSRICSWIGHRFKWKSARDSLLKEQRKRNAVETTITQFNDLSIPSYIFPSADITSDDRHIFKWLVLGNTHSYTYTVDIHSLWMTGQ